jgi:hypothetical protein
MRELLHNAQRRLQHWLQSKGLYEGPALPDVHTEVNEENDADNANLSAMELPEWEALDKMVAALPESYHHAFSITALEFPADSDWFVGRQAIHKRLQQIVEQWQDDRGVLCAITGPHGAGKTTLLNSLEYRLQQDGLPIIRFSIKDRLRSVQELFVLFATHFNKTEPCASIDELIEHLLTQKPAIIIIDDAQNIALRAMGAADVVHAFQSVLLATRQHFLWITSYSEYSWQRLDYQFNIKNNYNHILPVNYLELPQFSEAIQLRLETGGIPLIFPEQEPNSVPPEEDKSYEIEDQRTPLVDHLVRSLYSLSNGNIGVAVYYWMLAANYNSLDNTINVTPIKGVDLTAIRSLAKVHLFTLSELIGNAGLSCEEHAEIFQRGIQESYLLLESLRQVRLVVKTGKRVEPDIYKVNPLFYSTVSAELKSAHILY